DAEANAISDVGIGGQELWIDAVVFRDPLAPPPDPPRLAYGDGVDDFRMRDTAIRFEAAGVFAARAHRWQIDRADVRPYDSRTLAIARELFREGQQDDEPPREDRPPRPVPTGGPRRRPQDRPASRLRAGQLLSAVETLFTTPGALRGYALLAFRWHGCAVRHSTLAGRHGAHAWWWLRGAVHGCTLQGEESGLHAFWLYEAEWAENTVETEEGVALSVAGCCRARLEHNRLRGPMGVTNVPFGAALDGIDVLLGALRRGYGGSGTVATAVLSGIVVDESLRLMGFGPLLDALQPIVDEASPMPGIPVAYYVAAALLQSLRSQDDNAFLRALPLIDLHVAHNDVACRQQGVGFDAFIPLGSLRVSGNRIHTTTGQAVRIEANLFFANGHLTVFLVRVLLAQLRRLLDRTSRDSDGPLANVLRALRTLVEQWQAGAENLFDLDFRVEGNTIRSLRTAIESNLFELSVLTNHVTMQERTVAEAAVNTGRIFGIVTTPDGGSLPGSTVRVVGTERVATTGDKSEYELVGLPPGTYTLRATRAGYTTAVANVTLSAGEQAEVNFTISPFIVQAIAYFSGAGFSDAVLASQTMAAATASNAEMQQVMQALETSTALEPLAAVLREGAHTLPETYAAFLAASNGPLSTDAQRIAAADAATLIAGQTSDAEVERAAALLNDTLRANDRSLFVPHLTRFIRALQRYVDSQGILVEGLGGRIVENQVVVPADALPDTEALGGIQVSVNLVYLAVLAALGQILFRFLGGDEDEEPDVDPLLGITDTLIDTNEIVGGIGHGVSVQGVAGQPDFVRELRLRGNLIRGMAGAGVFINEHALVVGLDAGGNHVSECGREAGFTQHKGGFVVQTAAVCRFHGNQVVRCGQAFPARDDDQRQGRGLFGIALDAVYDVQCTDNEVQANGIGQQAAGGGILFEEVYGTTAVHDNRVAFNHGFGFRWINNPRGEDDDGDELPPPLPPFLVAFAHDYLRREDEGLDEDEQASVQDNLFRASRETFATAVSLVRLREVIFCGNTARTDVSGLIAGEIFETALGVVSNNLLRVVGEQPAFFISSMNGGVVANNVGNRPIQLFGSPAVIRVHNVPPAV
ncbi:MAG: carboxypeptidase-like regulatory domain-containing protein, partial [Rhodothermales bacterium]|nr:carboxypeptidase-like regulatory domain-containing protein [Rhodothermales bacterium]